MATEPYTLQPRTAPRYRYRWHSVAFLATMFTLGMVALAALVLSSRGGSSPLLDEATVSATSEVAATIQPARMPLAQAGDLVLMLPIYQGEISAIGYHPTSGDNVISLDPMGVRINGSLFDRSLGSSTGSVNVPGYFIMDESGDYGSPTGAMDIGAPAGTMVYSPVDGTVAGIKSYNLRGQCPDTEILIQPQQQSNLLVVLTHIDYPEASLGQPLKAGVTKMGAVRKMDGCYEQSLAGYTADDGNHLQIQVERSLDHSGL
jgi:hypothetical protein